MICFFAALCLETRKHKVKVHRLISIPTGTLRKLPTDQLQHPEPLPVSVIQIGGVVTHLKDGVMQQPNGSAQLFELPLFSDRKSSGRS